MKYNLEKPITRFGTSSYKWDYNKEKFGREDLIPFWVADMDFACAPAIITAIKERIEHPILGYTVREEEYYSAVVDWMKKRHNWEIEREWLKFCPPGAIQAIFALVQILSNEGDDVIVQTPAYAPLIDVVAENKRNIIENPLSYNNGRYSFDLEDLKAKITPNTKLLLLCSPHNPTGRVWRYDELIALAEICHQNNVIIISDEVHADLVFKENTHFPLGSLPCKYLKNSVTVISPSKSFNTAALPQSSLIIPSIEIRDKFQKYLDVSQLNLDNIFASVAMIASYRDCEDWLNEVMDYVRDNVLFTVKFFEKHFPEITVVEPEGTYLLWLDLKGLKYSQEEIINAMINIGGVALYDGEEFGQSGIGFFRLNLACPRVILEKGLEGVKKALFSIQEK